MTWVYERVRVKSEQELLDDLEDARAFRDRYVRGFRTGLTALFLSIGSILLGSTLGAGQGLPVALIATGVPGIIVSLGFLWLWFWYFHTAPHNYGRKAADSPHDKFRAAQRAHRDYLGTIGA